MNAKSKGNKLEVSATLDPKKFKTGKKGWYGQEVVAVGNKKVRLNIIAYEVTEK